MHLVTKYLKVNRNLEKLDLSDNTIGNEAIKLLSKSLAENKTRIKHLLIENCKITTDGVIILYNALKTNKHLTELSLARNDFYE
jgi:hypothetical protein